MNDLVSPACNLSLSVSGIGFIVAEAYGRLCYRAHVRHRHVHDQMAESLLRGASGLSQICRQAGFRRLPRANLSAAARRFPSHIRTSGFLLVEQLSALCLCRVLNWFSYFRPKKINNRASHTAREKNKRPFLCLHFP